MKNMSGESSHSLPKLAQLIVHCTLSTLTKLATRITSAWLLKANTLIRLRKNSRLNTRLMVTSVVREVHWTIGKQHKYLLDRRSEAARWIEWKEKANTTKLSDCTVSSREEKTQIIFTLEGKTVLPSCLRHNNRARNVSQTHDGAVGLARRHIFRLPLFAGKRTRILSWRHYLLPDQWWTYDQLYAFCVRLVVFHCRKIFTRREKNQDYVI